MLYMRMLQLKQIVTFTICNVLDVYFIYNFSFNLHSAHMKYLIYLISDIITNLYILHIISAFVSLYACW